MTTIYEAGKAISDYLTSIGVEHELDNSPYKDGQDRCRVVFSKNGLLTKINVSPVISYIHRFDETAPDFHRKKVIKEKSTAFGHFDKLLAAYKDDIQNHL